MKKRFLVQLLSTILTVIMVVMAFPLNVLAEAIQSETEEMQYIKSLRLEQAETKEEAIMRLVDDGYIPLENNLNEGTGEDGVWIGYQTTTDPAEAIYDLKLMNMNGGFTLTSMADSIQAQKGAFAEMATDLEMLIEEFSEAYEKNYTSAQKAYKALNFFRVVENESELVEANGLGYQLVYGGMTTSMITEIIMFCDPVIVDSIVKILTMGIQLKNESWIKKLSELGPYDDDVEYGLNEDGEVVMDDAELKRRADQLKTVLKFYADAYNAMEKTGLVSGKLDENFNITNAVYQENFELTADEITAKKADESRYKMYKVVFDDLEKYSYGKGETLKDFFKSLSKSSSTTKLYPLVSALSDGEFAALSYGCFLEIAVGANARTADFDNYDAIFAEATKDVKSVYLYIGVDEVLRDENTIIGFTEEANRHMAATGEMEFFENETFAEEAWETGKTVAQIIGVTGLAVLGTARVTMGVAMVIAGIVKLATGAAVKSAVYAGLIKVCAVISGPYALLITLAIVATVLLVSWLIKVISEAVNGKIDWDDNPMPMYLYDVREVTFAQKSENEGIATEYVQRPVYGFYQAVCDENGEIVDLNARSRDATQWIALYASYDKLGDDAKPITANDLRIVTGNGETPDGYKPLTRFGEVIAYDLNQWDDDDDVNGIYMFYRQDEEAPPVEPDTTFYIRDVYLQSGESPAHCIGLLQAAGYTPINVNLSPNRDADDDRSFTYIGYKTTTNEMSALRDIRVAYGPAQGEIQMGEANYAESGSNGAITLYTTKFVSAGTPILEGGLICVNDRADAPLGHEPVCLMGGGPAVSFNTEENTTYVSPNTLETYLYFLPETSFTDGTAYLGAVGIFGANSYLTSAFIEFAGNSSWENFLPEFWSDYSGYIFQNGRPLYTNTIAYYPTYNPYRAIYDVKASAKSSRPANFTFESLGYVEWNEIIWRTNNSDLAFARPDVFYVSYERLVPGAPDNMQGALYVSGNPKGNVYADGKMSEVQPLRMVDLQCFTEFESSRELTQEGSAYIPVTDFLTNDKEAAELRYALPAKNHYFRFYVAKQQKDRPYVTNVVVADELTLYRGAGGEEEGISRDNITDAMMYQQLAGRGATNFCGHRVTMRQEKASRWNEMNALLFGYTRSADRSLGLTDMFVYVNDFSFDDPPDEMYRNGIRYTLVCELPYNLTGYDGAPGPGVWLYGTTSSAAGAKIIDFEVSNSPFKEGYETLRTPNGRSPWSELYRMMEKNQASHFLGWARELFEDVKDFFGLNRGSSSNLEHEFYYFHIKREGDSIATQKPYVEKLYLTNCGDNMAVVREVLFDQGAEGYINVDLNTGAGGDYIYLGYSYTQSVDKAIKDIFAYHKKNPSQTMTADDGRKYTLVKDLDLNRNCGFWSDYIYLYTTTEGTRPITELSVGFEGRTLNRTYTEKNEQGKTIEVRDYVTKMWNTNSYSDLNDGAGGEDIFLFYKWVYRNAQDGTYQAPGGVTAPTQSRPGFNEDYLDPNGKYIAALYVMDKETIRKELGYPYCAWVSDQQVFARLKEMGATEIIETSISANSRDFGFWNDNKVYIGYSRTNDEILALKEIAIHVELISYQEPEPSIDVNKRGFNLVAEAASNVQTLPSAINLLSIGDGKQMAFPKMYLYTSFTGNLPPLTEIKIDRTPLLQGWNTVRSSNGLDPFVDIQTQAYDHYLLADKDDLDSTDNELVYTDSLFEWMDDLSAIFDPAEENVTTFYIHTKNYEEESIEELKPYIEEVFLASGETKYDALTKLVAFEPDGFLDTDLNLEAGGERVYLAYRRTEKASAALHDLMIAEGDNPQNTRRVQYNDGRVAYELVSAVDLNENAGGPYLHLYATDSSKIGNPITSIGTIVDVIPSNYVKCGVERSAVMLVERNDDTNKDVFTNVCIDLNKGAGGVSLYMYLIRETDEGHVLEGLNKTTKQKDATCGKDGYEIVTETCKLCKQVVQKKTIIPATGIHVDKDKDGDHRCDVCREKDVTLHVRGEQQVNYIVKPVIQEDGTAVDGYYTLVYKCTECDELLYAENVVIPATPENIERYKDVKNGPVAEDDWIKKAIALTYPSVSASIFGEGSVTVVLVFVGIGVLAAVLIPIIKKKHANNDNNNEE